jgi:hypothetical protein
MYPSEGNSADKTVLSLQPAECSIDSFIIIKLIVLDVDGTNFCSLFYAFIIYARQKKR